jgi:Fic family protein
MRNPSFTHYDLFLAKPDFDSSLTELIIDLNYLRKLRLGGTTRPFIFFQLKHIFHMLESIGSARIEGNNTTIAEYLDTKIDDENDVPPSIQEIRNIETAMDYIEKTAKRSKIDRAYISDIHKMIVEGLDPSDEGDRTPGIYRRIDIKINKSTHIPPNWNKIQDYMDELFLFINKKDPPKYDLLKTAIAHHRFVWVHPFCNGNGRTVRLFTYAMLVKLGFNVDIGRIVNPTAIFCIDRDKYYSKLSIADSGTPEGILDWCEYVLKGLKEEIEKIDNLLNYDYLKKEILLPVIKFSLEKKEIEEIEAQILRRTIEHKDQCIQASDIKDLFSGKDNAIISRQIKKLIDKKMLSPIKDGARRYNVRFDNNYLMRGFVKFLGQKKFLSIQDD